jgi:spore maturation protein CgeB
MTRLLVVGVNQPGHVGTFLCAAARGLGHEVSILDSSQAMSTFRMLQSPAWRLVHRPLHLQRFGCMVLEQVQRLKPDLVISTGLAPLTADCLQALNSLGIPCLNFSTDDPWSTSHRSRWFLRAIPHYTRIFSTRQAVIGDFQKAGASDVRWLPFAYCPNTHFPDPGEPVANEQDAVAFAGGADPERLALLKPLLRAGVPLALWGGYWERYSCTRPLANGLADPQQLRRLLSNTPCALTLVRHANRDGHAMRSLEVAAMAAPVLAEDTLEHRLLFGREGEHVLYFGHEEVMIAKARWLLTHREEGRLMGQRLHRLLLRGGHTYADRLSTMMTSC